MTAAAVEGVRVKIDEDATADLTLIEGRKLRGSVVDAQTGAPLAGVMVGYYGAARPALSGAACMTATTDAAGQFELPVPPGPSFVYIMDGRPGDPSRLDLDVPADRDPEPVRLLSNLPEPADRPFAKAKVVDVAKKAAVKECGAARAREGARRPPDRPGRRPRGVARPRRERLSCENL